MQTSSERHDFEKDAKTLPKLDSDPDLQHGNGNSKENGGKDNSDVNKASSDRAAKALLHIGCYVCHIPYSQSSIKASTVTIKCNVCK